MPLSRAGEKKRTERRVKNKKIKLSFRKPNIYGMPKPMSFLKNNYFYENNNCVKK
jgi:hypothetical protein